MGRFSVEFEVANNDDVVAVRLGLLKPAKVRRMRLQGLVDCGAARLVLPKKVVDQLGLHISGKQPVRYADRRVVMRAQAEGVFVELLGRHGVYSAVVEPKRETALIGAIVMEDLDFLIDSRNERLVPRDPKTPIYDIE